MAKLPSGVARQEPLNPSSADTSDSEDEEEDEDNVAKGTTSIVSPDLQSAIQNRPNRDEDNNNPTVPVGERKKPARRTHSVAHSDIVNKNVIIMHCDLEHGGENAGICQISAVIHNPEEPEFDKKTISQFNMYVKPPKNAVWDRYAMDVHGLGPHHPSIKSAKGVVEVWGKFCKFLDTHTGNKKVILCAWGGKSCDVKWLWKITEETHVSKCHMPSNIVYFLDPINMIKAYKSCQLHLSKSNLAGHGLALMWCFATGLMLNCLEYMILL